MTVAGKITDEDRKWATDFIHRHFNEHYLRLLNGNLPREAPDWHVLFHREWTADLGVDNYDKARWLRREESLWIELKAAYARFLDRSPADDDLAELISMFKKNQ